MHGVSGYINNHNLQQSVVFRHFFVHGNPPLCSSGWWFVQYQVSPTQANY